MEPRHLLSLPADERVDRLLFSGRAELQEHAIDVATYQCPHCSAGAEFNTGTLRKAERYRGSPLGAEWHELCEAIRALGAWEWALDFRCSKCGCPVRIVFAADGEFAMGAHNHRLLEVIEVIECLRSHAVPAA